LGVGMSTDEADPARAGLRPAVVPAVRRTSVMLMILGLVLIAVPAVAFADDTSPGRLDRSVQSLVDETPSGARDATLVVDWLGAGPILGTALVLGLAAVTGGVMAWAQIDLTAHYPTDTLGGFGSALLVIPVSALLIDRLGQRIVRRTDGP